MTVSGITFDTFGQHILRRHCSSVTSINFGKFESRFFAFLRRNMKLIVNALNEISDYHDNFYTDLISCLLLRPYFLGNSTFSLLLELQACLTSNINLI